MRVLAACSLGGAGHLQPLLPLLDAAHRANHETLVAGPPALSEMVAATGYSFSPGNEPPESEIAPIRERLPKVSAREASVLANRELFAALATDAMLPAMRLLVNSWRPDLILRDPCEYASAVVAQETGTAVAQVAIGLAEVEWNSIEIAGPALEARRRGLPEALRQSRYVTRFPASLDPSMFRDTRRFDAVEITSQAPLPDWWGRSRLPLVYLTFGTVLGHMTIALDVFRVALEAVRDVPARVLLTVGRRFDPEALGEVPANVHVESWVDQDRVLQEADVVVAHGGSGTTYGALRVGVPLVLIPLFADQYANSVKVAESESGILVRPRTERTPGLSPLELRDATEIATAINEVLAASSYRQRAELIGQEMAAAPSSDTILRELLDHEKRLDL